MQKKRWTTTTGNIPETGQHQEWEGTILDSPSCLKDHTTSDLEKIKIISHHFKAILETLGLELSDDGLIGTPGRVARMFVLEAFSGLNPANKPSITLIENPFAYGEMVVEKRIGLYSYCEHHFAPIIGKASIGYIPRKKLIGLSKINRLVHYYSRRPQMQERLTVQIAEGLKEVLQNEDVAVQIDATHLCVASRGIRDPKSSNTTTHFSGRFQEERLKGEFLALLN